MQTLIYVIIALCVILALALSVVLIYVWQRDKKIENGESNEAKPQGSKHSIISQTKVQGIQSMSKFLDFDEVIDSMIVRKNRTQYTMVIQCKGTNYDLLGEEEKLAVESGFIQFLNTIRFPIQLYIQTRSLNLKESIRQYQSRIDEVRNEISKLETQIRKEREKGRLEIVNKLEFDRKRKMNILEYGADVTDYIARMSQNRNVLQQNTYVVVAYYTAEFGGEISNYSKEEIDNIAFSELYTRAQTLIRGLSSAGVSGKVISSEELVELLYIAYNRDDSELINIQRAVDAEYDSLYNTAKDVFDKQKELIEEKADKMAISLVAKSITRADELIKLKKKRKAEIREKALQYIEQYKNEMTDELYEESKNQVMNAKIGKKKTTSSKENAPEETKKTVKTASSKETKQAIKTTRKRTIKKAE